ncbi:hypothetical protein JCM11251_005219 [Rhodosporidiobolus azoricus]
MAPTSLGSYKRNRLAFATAFFLFGTLNNSVYVVILSAALDLVDKAETPKGLILFANIAPALAVKLGWPYFVPGPTRYKTRVACCAAISFFGILVVAFSSSLTPRLLGISLASFSSGLGEMTYLQRATLYGSLSASVPEEEREDLGGVAVGWFSSGTGAAGVGGAGLWWVLRGLGVRIGLGVCSVLPVCMALTYFLLLPPLSAFAPHSPFSTTSASAARTASDRTAYTPLVSDPEHEHDGDGDDEVDEREEEERLVRKAEEKDRLPSLTTREKVGLARPLVVRFMLPLFFVYLAEYTINSGVAPTLLYAVPTKDSVPVLHLAIKSLRDYYPLWQLLYQTFVFISRSSLSVFHLPPLPLRLLPLPTLLQLVILLLTTLEASHSLLLHLAGSSESAATWVVAALVCCEGLCGGAAYVNAFHRLAVMQDQGAEGLEVEGDVLGGGGLGKSEARKAQEKEFQIASVGLADTLGILVASMASMVIEPALCEAQSLVRSRLSTNSTLLPPHLAQLVTALSLCARVSIRASALFLEAILESLQCTTVTGLGVTRRALIAAVGSARAMQYVKEGLDWSGRDDKGDKTQDSFLEVLDKWTNLGTYFIHHTFTLAELFTMSGFYLTLNTLQTGFAAAEESVRLLDSILGSNESSRALSSIITLVKNELTREDPRYSGGRSGAMGRLEDRDDDDDVLSSSEDGSGDGTHGKSRPSSSHVSNLAALTKALTAFACLQTATHRRTLRTLKLRVVYDCTVVVEGSSSSTTAEEEVVPEHSGKYAGPAAPPRSSPRPDSAPFPSPSSSSTAVFPLPAANPHQRAKSTSALCFTPLKPTITTPGGPTSRPSSTHSRSHSHDFFAPVGSGDILTDVRSELEVRAAARRARSTSSNAGSPVRSRCASVIFDEMDNFTPSSHFDQLPSSPPHEAMDLEAEFGPTSDLDLPNIRLPLSADLDLDGADADLLDPVSEGEIIEELEELCSTPQAASRARSMRRVSTPPFDGGRDGYAADEEGEGGDREADAAAIPLEVKLALQEIEERYRHHPDSSSQASPRDCSPNEYPSSPSYGSTGTDGLLSPLPSPASPASLCNSYLARPLRPHFHGNYSYEVEEEEMTTVTRTTTVTTTTTSNRTARASMPGAFVGGEVMSESEGYSSLSGPEEGVRRVNAGEEQEEEDAEWIEISGPSLASSPQYGRSSSGTVTEDDLDGPYPSVANGGAGGKRRRSVATLSRTETLERPEVSKQRLQVVLSTMTKKFTQRKRTVRQFSPSPPSRSSRSSTPTFGLPASVNNTVKRRWPSSRRSSTSTTSSSTGTATAAGSSNATARPVSPPPLVPPFSSNPVSPAPVKKGKASVLKAAVSKAFRQRQQQPQRDDAGGVTSDAFETAPSSAAGTVALPTPFLSPVTEAEIMDFAPAATPEPVKTASQTAISPSSAQETRTPILAPTAASPTDLRPPASSSAFRPSLPISNPSHHPPLRRAASVQTLHSTVTTTCTHAPRSASEARDHEGGAGSGHFPPRQLVENLQSFARYSSAAYGQSFLRILGIGKHEFKFPHTQIHANNHAFAHHVGIHVEDILLSSFTDPQPFTTEKISPIVNYVAVDHSISAIVLACRGSLGLSDILVDLTCDYEPIPVQDADPGGAYFVHSGMFCSATTMQRGTVHDVIKEAMEQFPDYGLVICGHSLGGGVASLLSILWSSPTSAFQRQELALEQQRSERISHPPLSTSFVTSFSSGLPPGRPISCYTYGVPCVASPDLVAYCRGLVISTVHNYDIVPTLSLGVLRDFKSMAMGFYAEQGTCEEIVGRVVGLCQRRFMAKRAAKKAAAAAAAGGSGGASFPFSTFSFSSPSTSSSTDTPSSPEVDSLAPDSLSDPSPESRLVPLTADEITAGRGKNKALAPNYQDPSLVTQDDLLADDVELSNWLWSLRTTIRASSDNEKLYPPGTVYVVENYTVFIASESSSTGKYSRREGRRVLLRAVDDVERRFSEPVFSKTMLSDHSPVHYEACCDLLAAAVL